MSDADQHNETHQGENNQQNEGNEEKNPVVEQTVDIVLAEYNTLRTELLQRLATFYQIMGLAFSAFAAILAVQAFGAGSAAGLYLVLLYPLLAFFLLNVYLSNSSHMRTIEVYIKVNIEANVRKQLPSPFNEKFGWQTHYDDPKGYLRKGQLFSIGGRFVFPATAFVAIISAFPGVWLEAGSKSLFLYIVFWVAIASFIISLAQAIWDFRSERTSRSETAIPRHVASERSEHRETITPVPGPE